MHGSDDLGIAKLPYMNMVTAKHARNVLDVFLDVLYVDVVRSSLKKDLGGGRSQGNGGLEYNQGDE